VALVHGDISPKNILVGPVGPVFLDAECAWFGDPAFDLAFCLNHLHLKCILVPAAFDQLMELHETLSCAYLERVNWEEASAVEHRTAKLLPALLLARVDGTSPVEYIVEDCDKLLVRQIARTLIASPVATLAEIRATWTKLAHG
jgi:aminoglycoside phosphotransferase (APT) family kinase protein